MVETIYLVVYGGAMDAELVFGHSRQFWSLACKGGKSIKFILSQDEVICKKEAPLGTLKPEVDLQDARWQLCISKKTNHDCSYIVYSHRRSHPNPKIVGFQKRCSHCHGGSQVNSINQKPSWLFSETANYFFIFPHQHFIFFS